LQLLREHHDAEWELLSVYELWEHQRVQLRLFEMEPDILSQTDSFGFGYTLAWREPGFFIRERNLLCYEPTRLRNSLPKRRSGRIRPFLL
jgi:hypothetical protein